ncbi:Fe2+ transport system protein A [Desulfitobacterium dichloroeliminans LMG P-21439]|uniref:Fe2+ transport system protein A n=1 Tax=Desulfitobacterium dichloroeliminans (strain LMG P-21439 / DCA1) TaxID=871963 RepID=L0F6S0_DESDL|nr:MULTISPECIES: FeoA family protein [Desulfitobacteriaceae]AGA68892.1 Fe2+ transport system protein A [Desulfitobacterium dichloroeliminans LMG P-21439]
MNKSSQIISSCDMTRRQEGVVAELATDNGSILRKLMSMGILPGTRIKLIQKFPSYVFQVGYTQVAVDREIASVISVNV